MMGCEFCDKADFSKYGIGIEENSVHICLAAGNCRFPNDEQFAFCPVCGAPLGESKPLTLDELRERDGRPVWVEFIGEWAEYGEGWEVVRIRGAQSLEWFPAFGTMLKRNISPIPCFKSHYGINWLAYDREPKEG